jgi:chromosome segregation ATPase
MNDLMLIPAILVSVTVPLAGLLLGKRLSGGESNEEVAALREEARLLETKIIDLLAAEENLISNEQLAAIQRKAEDYRATVESQRKARVEIEQKLTSAHADVIAREAAHQEMKAEKRDDEVALQSVMSNYSDISTESVSLERRLAESLKTIDKMSAEISMTEDQRAVFEALSTALTNASAQLRDVIVAHQNVYERLEALRSQYTDLEAEYIKLVELQLES